MNKGEGDGFPPHENLQVLGSVCILVYKGKGFCRTEAEFRKVYFR
jgi:hypothetical protein